MIAHTMRTGKTVQHAGRTEPIAEKLSQKTEIAQIDTTYSYSQNESESIFKNSI